MSGIFISHSSKNNVEGEAVRHWLEQQGWGRRQVFLDVLDLRSGDDWRKVLDDAMADKEAVIVCLSDEWQLSAECVREFNIAQERGKAVLPVLVKPLTMPIHRFVSDLQIGDTSEAGLLRLGEQLKAIRVMPLAFPWPPSGEPDRNVYRGLQALDVRDAAIFFGRDADITRGLDQMRRMRAGAAQRVLTILAGSGSGKSSFLRAGLIARLRRDDEGFLVMPVIRPGLAALTGVQGLVQCLSSVTGHRLDLSTGAAGLCEAFAAVRAPVVERLRYAAQVAGETYAAAPPTIVLAIDQAEELFDADNAECDDFCRMVAQAVVRDANAIVVATIRSDSYEAFQNGFMPDQQLPFTLPAVAPGAFQEIIEGPSRVAVPSFAVDPALTQHLLADLDTADALPLLAFSLERLLHSRAQADRITVADYLDNLGGLAGAIMKAVATVLGTDWATSSWPVASSFRPSYRWGRKEPSAVWLGATACLLKSVPWQTVSSPNACWSRTAAGSKWLMKRYFVNGLRLRPGSLRSGMPWSCSTAYARWQRSGACMARRAASPQTMPG